MVTSIKKLNKKNVAKNVGKLIVESQYTREELAEWLNVSSRVIYLWQEGKRIPSTGSIYMLSQLFEVSMENILA